MSDTETLATLKAAKVAIITGTQPTVVVDQNGERVEFGRANMAELNKEIARLEASTTGRTIRPARIII